VLYTAKIAKYNDSADDSWQQTSQSKAMPANLAVRMSSSYQQDIEGVSKT